MDGYNIPRYEPTTDPEQNAKEYAETQKQRQLERNVRDAKREAIAQDAAGNKEAFQQAAAKVKKANADYKAYCQQKGLTPRPDRLQVLTSEHGGQGYDRSMAGKVNMANRKNPQKPIAPIQPPTPPKPIIPVMPTPPKVEEKKVAESAVVQRVQKTSIERLEVKKLETALTHEEIVEKLSGGDMTGGSCVSLALAYAGNYNGYDVIDYRGGESKKFFSYNYNNSAVVRLDGVEGLVESAKSDFTSANKLIKQTEEGKLYYFTAGRHAAIIRKKEDEYQYLEMQSRYKERNTWHKLNDYALKERFGCQMKHSSYGTAYEIESTMFDITKVKGNVDFEELLCYINTKEDEQKKGKAGDIR